MRRPALMTLWLQVAPTLVLFAVATCKRRLVVHSSQQGRSGKFRRHKMQKRAPEPKLGGAYGRCVDRLRVSRAS